MKNFRNGLALGFGLRALALAVMVCSSPSQADDASWRSQAIADALLAAPPSVTDDAMIFGWTPEGELRLARYGAGPYTCIASGSFSVRLGKSPLPYPDPMCLDRNAWSFLQAVWSGAVSNGTERPLPSAPGLVWMLAGMNVSREAVDVGASAISVTEEAAEPAAANVVQMTPHVMIMPLPLDERVASLTTRYSLEHPLDTWIMAAGKAHEHLMVHFRAEEVKALMEAGARH